jgi:hypothetical protein
MSAGCRFGPRGFLLGVQEHELPRILERETSDLASGILGHPQSSALDRTLEPNASVGLCGHERMFPQRLRASRLYFVRAWRKMSPSGAALEGWPVRRDLRGAKRISQGRRRGCRACPPPDLRCQMGGTDPGRRCKTPSSVPLGGTEGSTTRTNRVLAAPWERLLSGCNVAHSLGA